ncbi:MAG: POTRA domain-containing protein [Terriglobales bacterium]|jgi:outer membrane protein assembly factor BamA
MSRAIGFLLCSALLVAPAMGQKRVTAKTSAGNAGKLIALRVKGSTRYTDQDLLAACGLRLGQPAADGDFKEAVQRLGDSGMFAGAAYSFSSSGASTTLELQLTDVGKDKLVPASFENFPWFTDTELRGELQRMVPLFQGEVPLAGSLIDHIQEALQTLLDRKQIPARVDYLRETAEEGGKLLGISYSVENLEIRIQNVEFPGATPDLLPGLQVAARRLAGAPYRRTSMAKVAEVDFLPVCLKGGYLRASFARADARLVSKAEAAPAGGEVEVTAILPLTPGKVYSTSGIEWRGNAAVATADLAPLVHLPVGQPADALRLRKDLESATRLYRSRGYMAVQIKPDTLFDDGNSAVHLVVNVVEGDLYKMGELEINGLDTQSTARMREAWTLREGQSYNADYPAKFRNLAEQILPRGVNWAVTVHESLDAKEKTVDVEVRFKQQ